MLVILNKLFSIRNRFSYLVHKNVLTGSIRCQFNPIITFTFFIFYFNIFPRNNEFNFPLPWDFHLKILYRYLVPIFSKWNALHRSRYDHWTNIWLVFLFTPHSDLAFCHAPLFCPGSPNANLFNDSLFRGNVIWPGNDLVVSSFHIPQSSQRFHRKHHEMFHNFPPY
jgi:hypothetical protein